MKCIKCGAEIKDGAKFCQVCGAKQEMPGEEKRFCKACGAPLKPGAAFCTACGAKAAADLPQQSGERTDNAQTNPASTASVEQSNVPQQETAQKPMQKKKSAFPIILAVVAVLCIGIAAAVIVKMTVFLNRPMSKRRRTHLIQHSSNKQKKSKK